MRLSSFKFGRRGSARLGRIFWRIVWRLIGFVGYVQVNVARHKLQGSLDKLGEPSKIVDFSFSFRALGISIRPGQIRDEIRGLLKLLQGFKLKATLEIGTAMGGTLFMFAQVSQPDATIISIDLPEAPFVGSYPEWRIPLYKSFARYLTQKIYLLKANSHDPSTLEKVKEILKGEPLDFLIIDADHTYEGVKKDFEMYSKLVRKGGIVAFHDIVPHDKAHDPEGIVGVPKFWSEIKRGHRCSEIVKNYSQGWAGIGVLYV